MAFSGDTLVAGSYHGFNVYKIQADGVPDLLSSVVCPGGQGDVSIVGDLLIMSVQETRSRLDCGLQGIAEDVSDERFRGIRIFNIADLENPVQVAQFKPAVAHIPIRSCQAPGRRQDRCLQLGHLQHSRTRGNGILF